MLSSISSIGQCEDTKSNIWHAPLGQVNTITQSKTPVQKCARSTQHVQFDEVRTPTKMKQMLRPRTDWEHPDFPKLSRAPTNDSGAVKITRGYFGDAEGTSNLWPA